MITTSNQSENRKRKVAPANGLAFQLRTEGSSDGDRIELGKRKKIHISTGAAFNGQRKAECRGSGCSFCERDKAVTRAVNIPVVVMDESCYIDDMPMSLHDMIADKVKLINAAGMDATEVTFILTKHRWRWEVQLDTPVVISPGKRLGKADYGVSSSELEVLQHLERWAARSLAQGGTTTNQDWMSSLVDSFAWDEEKAADLVARCVVEGRLRIV